MNGTPCPPSGGARGRRALAIPARTALRGIGARWVGTILHGTGAVPLYLKIRPSDRITVVCYHEVGGAHGLLGDVSLAPERFEEQIRYLTRHFTPVRIEDLPAFFAGESTLPPNPVVVTFDGGYRGNLLHAYPVLRKYACPAVIYLVTDCVTRQELAWMRKLKYVFRTTRCPVWRTGLFGQADEFPLTDAARKEAARERVRRFLFDVVPEEKERHIRRLAHDLGVDLTSVSRDLLLGWDEVRALDREGLVSFGSHTVTHPYLSRMPLPVIEDEVRRSKTLIEENLGKAIDSFCYPDGSYAEEVVRLVREAGYRTAVSTVYGINRRDANPLALRRVFAAPQPLGVAGLHFAGVVDAVKRLRRGGGDPSHAGGDR